MARNVPVRLPNAEDAQIERAKGAEDLLNVDPPGGQGTASVFRSFGFHPSEWEVLARALQNHALENRIEGTTATPFATKYTVTGPAQAPSGDEIRLRTVWIVEQQAERPRLITAYPIEASETDDS
jgi:hypothetical protein